MFQRRNHPSAASGGVQLSLVRLPYDVVDERGEVLAAVGTQVYASEGLVAFVLEPRTAEPGRWYVVCALDGRALATGAVETTAGGMLQAPEMRVGTWRLGSRMAGGQPALFLEPAAAGGDLAASLFQALSGPRMG